MVFLGDFQSTSPNGTSGDALRQGERQ